MEQPGDRKDWWEWAMPKRRKSITDGMTNEQKLESAVERELISLETSPCARVPSFPAGYALVLPGPKGHAKYVINIRDRLKAAGFCFDADSKVWYKALPLA